MLASVLWAKFSIGADILVRSRPFTFVPDMSLWMPNRVCLPPGEWRFPSRVRSCAMSQSTSLAMEYDMAVRSRPFLSVCMMSCIPLSM